MLQSKRVKQTEINCQQKLIKLIEKCMCKHDDLHTFRARPNQRVSERIHVKGIQAFRGSTVKAASWMRCTGGTRL